MKEELDTSEKDAFMGSWCKDVRTGRYRRQGKRNAFDTTAREIMCVGLLKKKILT